MHQPPRSARSGFTLIELMMVVVIIGLLAAIAVPALQDAQDKARNAAMITNIKTLQLALAQYASDNSGSYPPSPDETGTGITSFTATELRLMTYLTGGSYPLSPWTSLPQAALLPSGGAPLPKATEVQDNQVLELKGKELGKGINPGALKVAPTLRTHYGALMYSRDPDRQVTLLFGVGKKKDKAIVAAFSTGDAGTAGGDTGTH
ncbi:MAG: prepilin-type N-terminal cleavage/methylation domain-containing protein [Candidatus Sericytochromatia bacterium]|nr:prepilin-type N-terminal cleavage/methylation domain-containing protein [Candidatus Sericytochromatia bacterium]